jgi:hypothetical protein
MERLARLGLRREVIRYIVRMLIRFVTSTLDSNSGRRQGLFQAAGELRRSGDLGRADIDALDAARDWFAENLPVPTRFALSSRPHRKAQALSWFRDSATMHIGWMREYQRVLERHGVAVQMLRTKRAGYVLYRDAHQVVAYPFACTPC